jgi:alcohol dehydrogenase class IV
MLGFTLNRVPAVAVGPGRVNDIGTDVTHLAGGPASVLLVADPGLAALGITDRVEAALSAGGHRVVRFEDFASDPAEAAVSAGALKAWEVKAQAVVGLGGGSALDAAKMIAAMAVADRPVEDYRLAANPLPQRRVRMICVPTTAGTGSETTAVSVLSSPDHAKYWYWGDALKPDFVILDPVLTVGLPAPLTAATGVDALVHAIEAATNRYANPGNDFSAFAAIRLAVGSLQKAVSDPADLDARTRMLLAACSAGVAIDNVGTALAHNIGHALGSLMPIHHGRAVAIAMAATLPWVIEGNRDAFSRVAEAFGLDNVEALPDRFRALLDDLGIDMSLPRALDAPTLAARMGLPENAAMLSATARDVTPADLEALAEAVVATTTRSSVAA